MANKNNKPVIFLAFANDRENNVAYLRNLPNEARRLRDVLDPAAQAGLCEVVVRSNCTAGDIFKVFQDPKYRNHVAIFHFGGHANGYQLLLESAAGQAAAADAGGLAAFLTQQQSLRLVFLNGCSTQQQTQGLLNANVPAVISTSRSIEDEVATDFAHHFYQGLAGGATVRTAYSEAEAAVQTTKGGNTRDAYFAGPDSPQDPLEADRWPWNLYLREGADSADQWNLPMAVDDPLFGLPTLPEQDLPESPYRHLNWFTREDAEVFFGRGHQIRALYDRLTAPRTPPIMLFYGQSGVGKSSIIDAGLVPRLEQDYEVRYARRSAGGLLETLRSALQSEGSDVAIGVAWRAREEQAGKPLIVFLDQVEELYTHPVPDLPNELQQLLQTLKATLGDPGDRPRGKLVLGFRKEWMAELEANLIDYELPRSKVFLEPLDRRGIVEVVRGPAQTERLHERYGLTVEEGLAEIIADDLLEDRDSAIAPTLQILLTKLWTKATEENSEYPYFSQELYQNLKRDGILLRDFLNQQIAAFRARYPDAVDSGLLLDIVALHTTALGTAGQCNLKELQQQYDHLGATLPDLLQQCQDLHLLTVATSTRKDNSKTTRLAHDTLAPLVRERFDESDKPGQRARRILDNRSVDWAGEQVGTPLDGADLAIVEHGANGTRAWSITEQRLLEASRALRARLQRTRKVLKIASSAAVAVIVVVAGIAVWNWQLANTQKRAALIQVGNANWQRAVSARDYGQDDVRAAHLFVAAAGAFAAAEKPERAANSLTAIDDGIVAAFPHDTIVTGAVFNSDESQVLSWSEDGTVRIWSIARDERVRIFRHSGPVTGALFNGDGSRIISWSKDQTLRLWDPATDEAVRTFQHDGVVGGALFNIDESRLLSWSEDGTLRLWNPAQGEPVRTFRHGGQVTGALFSDDESRLLSWGKDRTVRLWDVERDEPLKSFQHDSAVHGAMFNGNGSRVVSWGHNTTLRLWSIEDDEPLRTFQQRGVVGALFNDDESRLLAWSLDGRLELWDPMQDEPRRSFQHGGDFRGALFSGDGSRILSWGFDGAVRLWDPEKDQPLKTFQHDNVLGASFSGDASWLLSWGSDGAVRLWDVGELEPLRTIQHGSFVSRALFNRDGSRLLSWSTDGMVRLWDTSQDDPLRVFKHDSVVNGASFNDDESRFVSWAYDGTIRLWNSEKDEPLGTFQHDGSIRGTLFNHDGSRLLSWSDDKTVRLWDVATDQPISVFKHDDIVIGALFNGDESRVVSWDRGTTVRLWDVGKDEPLKILQHGGAVTGAFFNPDGSRLLSAGVTGKIRLWNIGQDEPLRTFQNDGPVHGASFNGDGSRLLSWSNDETFRLWDIVKDEPLLTFRHDGVVKGAMFNGDESRIVSWSDDGRLNLWNPVKDEPLRTFQHDGAIRGALFNDDGSRLLSWSGDGTARLWDTEEDEPLRMFLHDRVFDAMFNNDESQVLSVGSDGTMKLWDPTQGQPLRTFQHYNSVKGASFNADAAQVLSWGGDGGLRLWAIPKFDDVSMDAIAAITLELEVRTAETITNQGAHRLLTFEEWQEKRNRLYPECKDK